MSRRVVWLVAGALALAAAYAVCRALAGGGAVRLVYTLFPALAEAAAAVGCLAAAAGLREGDYLRAGWTLQGLSYLVLCASALWRGFGPAATVTAVRVVLTLFTNVFQVAGTILFARTWSVAGVELPGSPARRRAFIAAAVAVALAAAGPPLVINARDLVLGRVGGFVGVFSSLGDAVALVLIAPILMTALALRGGLVAQVWTLFTMAMVSWLLFDAQDTLSLLVAGVDAPNPDWVRASFEPFRLLACGFTLAAGMTQRWISGGLAIRSLAS